MSELPLPRAGHAVSRRDLFGILRTSPSLKCPISVSSVRFRPLGITPLPPRPQTSSRGTQGVFGSRLATLEKGILFRQLPGAPFPMCAGNLYQPTNTSSILLNACLIPDIPPARCSRKRGKGETIGEEAAAKLHDSSQGALPTEGGSQVRCLPSFSNPLSISLSFPLLMCASLCPNSDCSLFLSRSLSPSSQFFSTFPFPFPSFHIRVC